MDEVGRGCLAGPVVAAAVVLDPEHHIPGLADSKAVPAAERERLGKSYDAEMSGVSEELKKAELIVSLSELEEICDHVGIIEHGKLVFSGTLGIIACQQGLATAGGAEGVEFRVRLNPGMDERPLARSASAPSLPGIQIDAIRPKGMV